MQCVVVDCVTMVTAKCIFVVCWQDARAVDTAKRPTFDLKRTAAELLSVKYKCV